MSGPENNAEYELSTTLKRQADEYARRGGHDVGLDQVLARAGEIRRGRRMRASMVMAAVVLAVALPVGITVIGDNPSNPKPEPPIATNPTAPSTPIPTREPDTSPIALEDLKSGSLPKYGIVSGGLYKLPGSEFPIEGDAPNAVAAVGNGLMLTTSDDSGNQIVRYVDLEDATSLPKSWPIEGRVAVSVDGELAAFTQPDGTVTVVQDRGTNSFNLGKIPTGSGFDTVSVNGDNCSGRSETDTCGVVVVSHGVKPQTWLIGPNAGPAPIYPQLTSYIGSTVKGLTAGMVSASDTGSCSEVLDHDDKTLWKTCDYRFLEFSPDGKYLLASGAYGDGFGDSSLAVLDAGTGDVVLDLTTSGGDAIPTMHWEDDAHVLAVVSDQQRWSVQRISLDGRREYAVQIENSTDDISSPFVLATR